MGYPNQQALLIISTFIIVPFLTYYITTILFHRNARSRARGKTPSTAPYYVPGIFHAFGLANTGPQKYFAQLIKEYGNFAPFYVKAGPQGLLIVREPIQVTEVLAASNAGAYIQALDKLFGLPPSALDLYNGNGVSDTVKVAFEKALVKPTQRHLTGTALVDNMETYISVLSANMNNKMFQVGTWTQIEDTWSFLQQVITRCTLESLFGTDLFKQYPGVVRDYWEFADATEGFVPGLPRYWVPSAASQVRDRLLEGLERWLKVNHSGSEFARIVDEDPTWDERKGSKLIQERDALFAGLKGIDLRGRAVELLSIMHEANSNTFPRVFWTLVELLRTPQLAKDLATRIDRYRPSQGAAYNISAITDLPLIDSLLAETTRLRVASIVAHIPSQSLKIGDHWLVPRNTPILMFSHDLALDTKAWEKARPSSVEKPLEDYWAERFILPNRSGSKANQRGQRNDASASLFSMEDLEPLNITMGRSQSLLLGKYYVRTLHAATLAILLSEFELQLCDPDLFDAVVPPVRETAFGMVKPLEKVAIRIRKHTKSGK
ncbi:putative cytochrome-like protein P450 [Ophiobolus disseminans]|uniref:Putative cytochrome-like protein P450 n=1 Tax=Ophiobolus disseminans TaxID=1469910 RepID=A0A6A6ZMH1_9PLEO|nr:putative cytochrome-like protein P450 [Ophiobolus disseminans]